MINGCKIKECIVVVIDVEPYPIYSGAHAKKIKNCFPEEEIKYLENYPLPSH